MRRECFNTVMKKTLPVRNAKIMFARTKPKGVSDVRWRIELRRRKMQDPNMYQDPDYMRL